jgi:hypothetical protein
MLDGAHLKWDDENSPRYTADITGRGLYEKYHDGRLKAYDLRNGQLAFTAETGQGPVKQVIKSGSYLIVEKEGTILGYKLPVQLR